ncbi:MULTISPECIES: O-antigen ligase family protein [unclassified Sinorhizobium]|uniref:O-antigen ligase family protein n=1 Tax=unclassified Sinorhizobium TaxID=2613772 RepID=UPI0024C3ACB5|nr:MULTISPECIES: O-antigen ligase family protein [unclassified Sinorhizobium]MDK1374014.1 O-antigen ligase family protein [Sinorhizobium sp. 6-70]MDK1477427.1 O-antigen ligase family protein [Sinorhizobium sp. 6-117]
MSRLYRRPKAGELAGTLRRAPFTSVERRAPTLLVATAQPHGTKLPWPATVFLVSLIVPSIVEVGPLSIAAYRAILMIALVPCVVTWLRGGAGRINAADIGVSLFCLWAWVSVAVNHGFSAAVEPGGILLVETLGAYLLARCYVRDAESFRNMTNLMVKLILLLFPFAVYEWITGSKPILSAFGFFSRTVEITMMEPRLGFWRVQGPFAHSIMFGLFCGSMIALAHFVEGSGWRRLLAPLVAGAAVLSMSSATIATVFLQGALISWNSFLRAYENRWKLLQLLIFAGYLVVEFGSNQTPIQFYISKFTLDRQTGWFRLWIWEYGSASVLNHPLFGIGFGDWVRPNWMAPDSVDNFWLLTAMRYGLPALIFILGSFFWIVFKVAYEKTGDEISREYRVAYLICMTTFFVGGTTVHLWAAPYAWFLYLMGSGVWFFGNGNRDSVAATQSDESARRALEEPLWTRGSATAGARRRHVAQPSRSSRRRHLAPRN